MKPNKKALIVVDMQVDFCPGGNLAVPGGDSIVDGINKLMSSGKYDLIVATQDFHPADHKSFAVNNKNDDGTPVEIGSMGMLGGQKQVMWPSHCVQGTDGVNFHPELKTDLIEKVFPKGTDKEIDSYSGFMDNDKKKKTGLGDYLLEQGITDVDVVGLALDYCVKATALDAKDLGLKTTVLLDETAAVNLQPVDGFNAQMELIKNGVDVAIRFEKG